MPSLSERKSLLNDLDFLIKVLAVDGKDNSSEFAELMELKGAISTTRYLNLRIHLEKNRTMNDML